MSNKTLFASAKPSRKSVRKDVPVATAKNNAGGLAYQLADKEALAQFVVAGFLGGTYYTSAQDELKNVLAYAGKCSPEFVAKAAIYSRAFGKMKDMPPLLLAHLSTRGTEGTALVRKIFNRVINNTKTLRNFFQIIRSGQVGRKNFGTALRDCMSNWLGRKTEDYLFDGSVGNDPTLGDVIKLSHIKPNGKTRENFHNYLMGREYAVELLPERIRNYEAFKKGEYKETPQVPFDFLTSLTLSDEQWKDIARNAPWNMTRMNLNTFARHNVLKDKELVRLIADRLRDPELVAKFNVFPYQLMTALNNVGSDIPHEIKEALQDALDLSIENVPSFGRDVAVCIDVSGSMSSQPVTGNRGTATTQVKCIDVAALIAASILRKNKGAKIVPFDGGPHVCDLNGRDSVWTNAKKLRAYGGGATNCSSALKYVNDNKWTPELVIFVSDNESWVDRPYWNFHQSRNSLGTPLMEEFSRLRKSSKDAKMICIDLAANATTQAPSRENVLNVGGYSDAVFDVIENWSQGNGDFVKVIEQIDLDSTPERV